MGGRPLSNTPRNADDVQCLFCGLWGPFLGTHIRRRHGLSATLYRQVFDLRRHAGLASDSYRAAQRDRMNKRISAGTVSYAHLPVAVETARTAGRGFISTDVSRVRSQTATAVRPGDHSKHDPADARTLRRRLAQQRRRMSITKS